MAERSIYAYDPIIPPERKVVEKWTMDIYELSQSARETGKILIKRYGESYFCACACGSSLYTPHETTLASWRENHASHVKEVMES